MMKDKRIESICRVVLYGQVKFEIKLKPNYSFESSGAQIMYCSSEKEIDELKNEIVFCDGKIVSR